MDTLMKADIFFFISSISAVVFLILGCIVFYYVIRILVNFKEVTEVLKSKIEIVGDDVHALARDVRESFVFALLFGKKKKKK